MNNPNHSNQMNSNNSTYWSDRGQSKPSDWSSASSDTGKSYSQKDYNNHSNQLNPNNSAYGSSRGHKK